MASMLVDGLRLPVPVGGHPAIDFCNTRAGWGAASPREYLVDYQHLTVWAREADLVQPATARRLLRRARLDPGAAAAVAGAALDFRGSLYDVLVGARSPQAWRHVAAAASAAMAASTLAAPAPDGSPARWELAVDGGLEIALLAVVTSATGLLTSPLAATVSACPMPDCGWAFANPSGRRTWCSMAWCGNRAKVRRFAERHRA